MKSPEMAETGIEARKAQSDCGIVFAIYGSCYVKITAGKR
jgi:hypothetical protein